MNNPKDDRDVLEKYLNNFANFLNDNHSPKEFDLIAKYSITDELLNKPTNLQSKDIQAKSIEVQPSPTVIEKEVTPKGIDDSSKERIYTALKEFRLQKCREENIKAYYIFTNAQLDELIEKLPKNEKELLEISGFGKSKVDKYGPALLKIINV